MRGKGKEQWADRLKKYRSRRAKRQALTRVKPLFVTIGCATEADDWCACVEQRGGEYTLAFITGSHDVEHPLFLGVSTTETCDDPGCRRSHTADENHLALIRSVLKLRGPESVRASPGWRS